jgi:hypothetical protein
MVCVAPAFGKSKARISRPAFNFEQHMTSEPESLIYLARHCDAKMAMLPAYQKIIGLGPATISLILAELRREPDFWFRALEALTGADPVQPGDRDNVPAMAAAWLAWSANHGYPLR